MGEGLCPQLSLLRRGQPMLSVPLCGPVPAATSQTCPPSPKQMDLPRDVGRGGGVRWVLGGFFAQHLHRTRCGRPCSCLLTPELGPELSKAGAPPGT